MTINWRRAWPRDGEMEPGFLGCVALLLAAAALAVPGVLVGGW